MAVEFECAWSCCVVHWWMWILLVLRTTVPGGWFQPYITNTAPWDPVFKPAYTVRPGHACCVQLFDPWERLSVQQAIQIQRETLLLWSSSHLGLGVHRSPWHKVFQMSDIHTQQPDILHCEKQCVATIHWSSHIPRRPSVQHKHYGDTVFSKLYTSETRHSSHTSWNTLLQSDLRPEEKDPRCSSQQPYTVELVLQPTAIIHNENQCPRSHTPLKD